MGKQSDRSNLVFFRLQAVSIRPLQAIKIGLLNEQIIQKQQSSAMSKSSVLKVSGVLLLVVLLSYSVWDNTQQIQPAKERLLPASYQTSTTRTNNVNKYCAGLSRTSLSTSTDASTAQTNMNSVNTQLGIDGNSLMNKLAKMDLGGAVSIVSGSAINLGIFVAVFLLPFFIFLWVWPFLCCCCCCPSCCPSKCCQKAENEPYTKCQLFWPAIILILALLLTISTSIYGFVNASNVGPTFSNMGCAISIFIDDLLNGNVTANGTGFFTGLNVFSSSLTYLNNNLTDINTYLADLSNTAAGNTYTDVQNLIAVETDIKKIPDGLGTGSLSLNYNTPINQGALTATATTGTLASSFISTLGTYGTADSLVSKLYLSVYTTRLIMEGIKNNSNSFSTATGTIGGQISTMQTTINSLVTDISNMDSSLGSFLGFFSYPGSYGNMGMQAFYGVLIGFSFLALIGALLTVCCDKPGCRHLMYFACIFLFIGALIGFMISVLFSIFVPLFTWTCSYLSVGLASSAGFSTNFGAFLSNSTVNQISVCMPYGDGNIVNTVAGSAANGLNNLTSVISSLNTFNNATLETYITNNLSTLATTTNKYANGDISDLDTTNSDILNKFSDPTNTTNSAGCTAATFAADSWVPSNSQDTSYSTAVSCKVSSGNTGERVNCDANYATIVAQATCGGCMDATQLLSEQTLVTGVVSGIKSRYSATCAFANILGNAWNNYYSPKFTALGYPQVVATGSQQGVMLRVRNLLPTINDTTVATSAFKSIDDFKSRVNTISTNLATISSLTDPTYGMLAGLNCKLFGQDFVTFQNIICGSFYNNMYIIRLTFGIASWGILFAMCCMVCTGVRHFKQVDKMKKIADANMQDSFHEETKNKLRNNKE